MTALDEVLKAEKDAAQAIATAKDSVVKAVSEAESERTKRLQEEKDALQSAEIAALAAHQKHIDGLVGKIESDTVSKIAGIANKFSAQKKAMVAEITQSFQ